MSDLISVKITPSWNDVEKQITEEINWLRNSISLFHAEEKYAPINCKDCLLRKIAILIVSGKVEANNIEKAKELKSFWLEQNDQNLKKVYHGKDWHNETMGKIENHFLQQGFDVLREPTLQWGRADLGVYKKEEPDLLIEIGTTSLFKLWLNLAKMQKFIYLIVPNDEELLEFICH